MFQTTNLMSIPTFKKGAVPQLPQRFKYASSEQKKDFSLSVEKDLLHLMISSSFEDSKSGLTSFVGGT